jgi:ceramide glucosyltransferase
MKSTRFSRPKGHLGMGLTFSVPFGLLGAGCESVLGHGMAAGAILLFSIVNRMVLAGVVGGCVVEDQPLWRTMLLFPVRDLMGFFFWAASYAGGTIHWRGRLYRLGEHGLMLPAGD